MDVLRAALGESTLTYFGASYGTKLGATYAELFPHQVGRIVLDGAVDLSISTRQLSLQQAEGFETALRAYVQNCVDETDGCFLGDSVDEGVQRIQDFLDAGRREAAADRPRPAADGRATPSTASWRRSTTATTGTSSPPRSSRASPVTASTLLQLSDLYTSRGAVGATPTTAPRRSTRSTASTTRASIPASKVPAQEPAFEEASPTFGDVFAWGLTGCRGQQARSDREAADDRRRGRRADRRHRHDPRPGHAATRGPRTWPTSWTRACCVTRDGDGHTGYNAGNDCVDDAVEAYLVDGTVPRRRPGLLRSLSAGAPARRSPGSARWPARSSAAPRARGWRRRGARSRACRTAAAAATPSPRRGASRGSSCSAAPRGTTESASPMPTSSTAVSTSSTSIRRLRVAAGLVQHLAQHDPGRVVGPPGRLRHHQRRLGEPLTR